MKRVAFIAVMLALIGLSIGAFAWRRVEKAPRTSVLEVETERTSAVTAPKHEDQVVSLILGNKGDGSYESRWNAISQLSKTLSPEQRQQLYDFLQSKDLPEKLTAEKLYEIKNDILNQLREQVVPPPELTGILVSMYQDREQDPVIRDYALQHMQSWYGQSEDKQAIARNLWQASTERRESFSGTALLGLYRLSCNYGEIDSKQIAATALSMVQDEKVNSLTRITAMQVCGQLGLKQISPLAQKLADASDSLPLRLSCLATLGDIGGSDNLRYLEKFALRANSYEQVAVSSAIQRARKRM